MITRLFIPLSLKSACQRAARRSGLPFNAWLREVLAAATQDNRNEDREKRSYPQTKIQPNREKN